MLIQIELFVYLYVNMQYLTVVLSVQSLSRVRLFATPWIAARQASLSVTNSRSSLRLTSIESVMPCSHLILCRPLLLLPPIPPSISMSKSLWKLTFQHQVQLLVTGLCLWSHYSQIFKRAVCKDYFLVFWGNLNLQSLPRALYLWASSKQSFFKSPVRDGWSDGCRGWSPP